MAESGTLRLGILGPCSIHGCTLFLFFDFFRLHFYLFFSLLHSGGVLAMITILKNVHFSFHRRVIRLLEASIANSPTQYMKTHVSDLFHI